jgi:AraC-like DNA-binding protein
MRYFAAGRFVTVPPRRLSCLWAGVPHVLLECDPDAECTWITIPLAWFLAWEPAGTLTRRLLEGEIIVDPDPSSSKEDLAAHARWVLDMASADPDLYRAAMLEVEARIRRLAHAVARASPLADAARAPGAARAPAQRIASFVGEHYQEDLSVEDIAEAVGLHAGYAMSSFKQSCGMGIWDYLTRLRVSHAQRLLLTSDAKVLKVALESGFGSQSRFYDTFSKIVGMTPRAYRVARRSP